MKNIIRKILVEEFVTNKINECTIAAVRLKDSVVLAKNRDRGYRAKIEIVHEIVNNVEVVYWRDVDTDWSEGMNEFGIGIINSSLWVIKDEKEGHEVKSRREKSKTKVGISNDGKKIRKALSMKSIENVLESVMNYSPDKKTSKGLRGVTFISNNDEIYVAEIDQKDNKILKKLKKDKKVLVRTNHGIFLKKTGYLNGEKRKSSIRRMDIANKHLQNISTDKEILKKLKKKYEKDIFYNPYRSKNMYNMQTTGQIMLNLQKKEVTVTIDNDMGKFIGIKNNLPSKYRPKIKIKVLSEK